VQPTGMGWSIRSPSAMSWHSVAGDLLIRCSQCGQEHDIFSIEPRYGRPEAYLCIPAEERQLRAHCGNDWCRLRDEAGPQKQRFLRATLPVEVLGENRRLDCR